MRRWVFVGALFVFSSRDVAAQEPLDFLNADRETVVQVARIIESVKAANLPTEPVVAKARLAVRRKVPPARMIAALQAVASRLEEARATLGPTSPEADILAGQDALSTQGVTKDMLRLIRDAQPNSSIAVPLGVLAQLVASGVEPKKAAEIVSRLVRARATSVQLVALGSDVSRDVGAGAGAASALNTRLDPLKPLLAYGASAAASAANAADAGSQGFTAGAGAPPKSPLNPRGRP